MENKNLNQEGKQRLDKSDVESSINTNYVFERGDVISDSSKKDVRLILKKENQKYYFIYLKSQNYKDIFGRPMNVKKGDEASQPADIVNKHFCLVEF